MISLQDQIKCAERELALRKRVYAKRVLEERMDKKVADHEIAAMAAILENLRRLHSEEVGGLFEQ